MTEAVDVIKRQDVILKDYDLIIHKKIIICSILGVILLLCVAFLWFLEAFQVTNVYVEGNEHYTSEEIRQMIETGRYGDNSLYLSFKYRNKHITNIPFIEKMDVDVVDRNTIHITVYEKALAGYVEYLDNYMYFDKDGVIVESSDMQTAGIPLVTGLKFDHMIMYEPLPVENEEIFQTILNVTQMLNKYEIVTDKIYFNDNYEMILYFGDVRVDMGGMDLLEEKIQRLGGILPLVEGKSGTIHMDNYESGDGDITMTLN